MAKKKIRFNAVDAVILLFAVLAVAAFGYVFLSGQNADSEKDAKTVKVQYVLKVPEIKDIFLGNIKKGDELIDSDVDKKLGTVVAVSSAPAKRIGTNTATGAQVISEIEGRSNLFITLESEAQFVNDKYFVDGVWITVGNSIGFITPDLCASSCVISAQTVE